MSDRIMSEAVESVEADSETINSVERSGVEIRGCER